MSDWPHIDSEVKQMMEHYARAQISLHRGDLEVTTFSYWGRIYQITVDKEGLHVQRIVEEDRQWKRGRKGIRG